MRARHFDEARARRLLGVRRDRIFQIAEHYVDLRDQLRHLGADLGQMRRHEVDHPLEPDGQFAKWLRRSDREGFEERAGELHQGQSRDAPGREAAAGMRTYHGALLATMPGAVATASAQ